MLDVASTFTELERCAINLAVLPVGAIEQHGGHLPISVDWTLADALGRSVAKRLGPFVLSGLPFGNSEAHRGFRGSISVRSETLKLLVADVVKSLFDQGFSRVIVLNTHGGNLILKLAVRALNLGRSCGHVVLVFPPELANKRLEGIIEGMKDEQHAGELETSLMLYLSSEQVCETRVDHVPDVTPTYFDYAPMKLYCPDGVWGRPSLAKAEKGRRAFEIMVEDTAKYIENHF